MTDGRTGPHAATQALDCSTAHGKLKRAQNSKGSGGSTANRVHLQVKSTLGLAKVPSTARSPEGGEQMRQALTRRRPLQARRSSTWPCSLMNPSTVRSQSINPVCILSLRRSASPTIHSTPERVTTHNCIFLASEQPLFRPSYRVRSTEFDYIHQVFTQPQSATQRSVPAVGR